MKLTLRHIRRWQFLPVVEQRAAHAVIEGMPSNAYLNSHWIIRQLDRRATDAAFRHYRRSLGSLGYNIGPHHWPAYQGPLPTDKPEE